MQNPPNYGGPSEGAGKSSTGLDANVAALLSYILTWLSGLIFFLMEKENRYVRFHAMQAILLGVGFFAIWIAFVVVRIMLAFVSDALGSLFSLLMLLMWLGFLAVWVLCLVKAYQGQRFKLPVIGDMAERFAGN